MGFWTLPATIVLLSEWKRSSSSVRSNSYTGYGKKFIHKVCSCWGAALVLVLVDGRVLVLVYNKDHNWHSCLVMVMLMPTHGKWQRSDEYEWIPLMLMLMLINGSHSQSHGWEASVQGLYCICTSLTYSPLLMKNLVWQIFFCTDILCQRYRIVPAVVLISWFTWSPPLWKANSRVRTSFHVRRDLSFLRFQI